MNKRQLKKMMLRTAAGMLETNLGGGLDGIHGIPMYLPEDEDGNAQMNPEYVKAEAMMNEIIDELYRRGTP